MCRALRPESGREPSAERRSGIALRACSGRAPASALLRAGARRAWRGSGEHPFLLDNLWDLRALVSYLSGRADVDAARLGATGVSLGGMHAWLLAALEPRIACAAPLIGVQARARCASTGTKECRPGVPRRAGPVWRVQERVRAPPKAGGPAELPGAPASRAAPRRAFVRACRSRAHRPRRQPVRVPAPLDVLGTHAHARAARRPPALRRARAQSFGWSLEHKAYQARVASIPAVFDAAAADLGGRGVTQRVVRAVWEKLLPGLLQARGPA